jgi:hypothetical protein
MGYRVFKDSHGTEWQTWDVVPQLSERRMEERRRQRLPPPSAERRSVERRVVSGRRPMLSAGLDGGWLCFEASSAEKRRLTPIPGDWQRCAEQRLEQYLQQAKPALRASAAVDISTLLDQRR